ncbi:hypothetical protein SUGI_1073980 [Cryptomeria japonica]|nr:hypothetical protein SUGI_1073980 [Cryptomeria japonica]
MGNAILFRRHNGRIRIMKLDGQVLKVKGPLIVDDILADYPGYVFCIQKQFVIWESEQNLWMDLPLSTLSTSIFLFNCQSWTITHEGSILGYPQMQNTSSSEMSEDNGALQIKVRMRRVQLIEMMAKSEDSSETAERIMDSLLNQAKSQQMERGKVKEEKDDNLPWKPSLESVLENPRCLGIPLLLFLV